MVEPLLETATLRQLRLDSTSLQLSPKSVERQSFPPLAAAITTEQSESQAMARQFWTDATSLHVTPESVDLYIFPPATVAYICVPSAD